MTDTAIATEEAAPPMPAPNSPSKADAVKWIVDETRAGREPTAAAVRERFSVSPRTATNYRTEAREVLDAGAPVVPIRPPQPARPEPGKPASATPPPVADRPAPAAPEVPAASKAHVPATHTSNPAPATPVAPDPQPARAEPATPVPVADADRHAGNVPVPHVPVAHVRVADVAPAGASDALVRATTVAVAAVALVAAVVSYEHMRLLAEKAGESWWRAALLPLSVDGLVIVASAVMLTRRRGGRPGGKLAGSALTLGIVASLAANVVSADPTLVPDHVVRWVVAGYAPVSLGFAFELFLQLRAERSPSTPRGGPRHSFTGSEHRPDAGDSPVTRHRSATDGRSEG